MPSNGWCSVAASADGTKLVAASGYSSEGLIYTSTNSGTSWAATAAPTNSWISVASSPEGAKLAALATHGPGLGVVYLSTNSGATWVSTGAPAWQWRAVALSADGSNLVAVGNGVVGVLRAPAPPPPPPPSPALSIGVSGVGLGLSWLVPSASVVLQQNSDLTSPNWVEVPGTPTLNFTNLHNELALPPRSGNSFYRLRQQ